MEAETPSSLTVEVPLHYLDDEAAYMAGYLWGSKVRQADHDVLATENPRFIQGVQDGYGDAMTHNREAIEVVREQQDRENKMLSDESAVERWKARRRDEEYRRRAVASLKCDGGHQYIQNANGQTVCRRC